MRIISFNVNGLTSFNKYINDMFNTSLNDYMLNNLKADILCVQETRGSKTKLEIYTNLPDYRTYINYNKIKNGHAGVCFFIKKSLYCRKIYTEINEIKEICDQGRVIVGDFGSYKIYNLYFPFYDANLNGSIEKYEKVVNFYNKIGEYIKDEDNVIICGDFNACYMLKDHYQYLRELNRINNETNDKKDNINLINNEINDSKSCKKLVDDQIVDKNMDNKHAKDNYSDKKVNNIDENEKNSEEKDVDFIEKANISIKQIHNNNKTNKNDLVNIESINISSKNDVRTCYENFDDGMHSNNPFDHHKKDNVFNDSNKSDTANEINNYNHLKGIKRFKSNEKTLNSCTETINENKIIQTIEIVKNKTKNVYDITFEENQKMIEKPFRSSTELPYYFKNEYYLQEYFFEMYQRKWLLDFIAKESYIDVYNYFNPNNIKYTCWNTRFDLRPCNLGTRIDYFFISKNLLGNVKKIQIDNDVFGSDHCPVILDIDLDILNDENNILKKNSTILSFFSKIHKE
ncbi:hypothetical protein COBT_000036 [Conglomerata obtusa]